MRFIIREQEFETRLAAGKLRYEAGGRPTGMVEEWRLTAAVEGYTFLRVDLDARQTKLGFSTLYHLTLSPSERPERLKFRHFSPDYQISGDVLMTEDAIMLSRQLDGERIEEEMTFSANQAQELFGEHTNDQPFFWFPTTLGMGLLAKTRDSASLPAHGPSISLADPEEMAGNHPKDVLALRQIDHSIISEDEEEIAIGRDIVIARPLSIHMQNTCWRIWMDEWGLPLRRKRSDGLEAVETRIIRGQQL